jgi:uncharacterized membrane protein
MEARTSSRPFSPAPGAQRPSGFSRVLSGLSVISLGAYPIVAYVSLRTLSPRAAAAVMLAVIAPPVLFRLRRMDRQALRSLAALPVLSVALLVVSFALNSAGVAMFVPVLLNLGFLLLFGSTLGTPLPMIERFARLTDNDLTPAERRWCRLWTWIWVMFFGSNVLIAGSLALAGAIGWWTTYTGLVSYVMMGLLFGIEYPLRKYRFGRLRSHFLDRQLERTFRAIRGTP